MDWTVIPAVVTALTGVLVAFGGGIKWMLSRMDRQNKEEREWQNAERAKLETQFAQRIAALEDRIKSQESEIESTRTELRAYVRHVGVLEGLLKAHGVEVPSLEIPTHGL